jgi:hypothetical protein
VTHLIFLYTIFFKFQEDFSLATDVLFTETRLPSSNLFSLTDLALIHGATKLMLPLFVSKLSIQYIPPGRFFLNCFLFLTPQINVFSCYLTPIALPSDGIDFAIRTAGNMQLFAFFVDHFTAVFSAVELILLHTYYFSYY